MRGALVFLVLGLGRCQSVPTPPPPANVVSAPALKAATSDQSSKASAAVQGATLANQSNPEGMPKTAVAGELTVATANLPLPTDQDRLEALQRVNAALSGDLAGAKASWLKATSDAALLSDKVRALEAQVEAERLAAAQELQRQLATARNEERQKAEAAQRKLLGLIFYGFGALLVAAGAAMLLLGAQIPFLGPRAALSAGGAGIALIATGVATNELLNHAWVIWVGLATTAIALAVSGALLYSNHQHGTPPQTK